jgi:addiction module RelE/StbE family toxin
MAARGLEIRWAPVALSDLLSIIGWIRQDRPVTADSVRERLMTSVARLSRHPLQGRSIPEFRVFGRTGLREIVVSPWRVFYEVRKGAVAILAVVDGRRNVEDLLLRRLARRR